ncbi:glycosyltransferase [uncultured Methanoregula sp.]|uniref:glycosyltransferase n=1 Tax=uncultured Methanoregula sp. TaxID=1005933 RepID=UPI002AAAD058|nr:glycosyltransferase [uncultured Methanoregula sp.]
MNNDEEKQDGDMIGNSQKNEPLVSICIPVYNGEKTIRRTIESVINQTYKNLEIIVVDNCSKDSTVKIVQEFNDPRIRLILNDIHVHCAEYNWNRCFPYVKGEYMAFFHADDTYTPSMVFRQIETFKKFPQVGGIFTMGNRINEMDEIVGKYQLPPGIVGMKPHSFPTIFLTTLQYSDFLLCPSAMLRTKLYERLLPFRYDQFGSASDLDMWLRAEESAPLIILDEPLMNYRVSQMQETYQINLLKTTEADFFKVMDFHIEQNKKSIVLENRVKNRYELFRFEDQLNCALSYIHKGEIKNFRMQLKIIPWHKYLEIYLRDPQLLHPRISRGIFGRLCRLSMEILHTAFWFTNPENSRVRR